MNFAGAAGSYRLCSAVDVAHDGEEIILKWTNSILVTNVLKSTN